MATGRKSQPRGVEWEVSIDAGKIALQAALNIPEEASGIVLFAHGSGSSRRSPRNRYVAGVLQANGMATLLFDLLTRDEEYFDQRTAQRRFDIPFLAKRLCGVTRWILRQPETRALPVGYFGASTGAAAALVAAAQLPDAVAAIVSRGGRPDLAGKALASVQPPTLLIVGENDQAVVELNREALSRLHCSAKDLVLIPGATHLFEEPGTLEEAARIGAEWFSRHFAAVGQLQA